MCGVLCSDLEGVFGCGYGCMHACEVAVVDMQKSGVYPRHAGVSRS